MIPTGSTSHHFVNDLPFIWSSFPPLTGGFALVVWSHCSFPGRRQRFRLGRAPKIVDLGFGEGLALFFGQSSDPISAIDSVYSLILVSAVLSWNPGQDQNSHKQDHVGAGGKPCTLTLVPLLLNYHTAKLL